MKRGYTYLFLAALVVTVCLGGRPQLLETANANMIINPYRFGGGTPWTPADITTLAWYDASDASTIHTNDAAGRVSQWDDKSGNDTHALQSTGARQPSTGVDIMNGLNIMTFLGDFLTNSTEQTNVSAALFVTKDLDGAEGNGGLNVFYGAQNASDSYTYFNGSSLELTKIPAGDWSASVYGSNLVSGAANLDVGITDKTDDIQWYMEFTNSAKYHYLAAISGSQVFELRGKISEVIFLDATPSTETRQKLEGYLAHKWGLEGNLPAGHPYKASAPTQ